MQVHLRGKKKKKERISSSYTYLPKSKFRISSFLTAIKDLA